MLPILLKDNKIDDIYIQKFSALNKAEKLLSILDNVSSKANGPMIRTASSDGGIDKTALLNLFIQMLGALNLKTDEKNAQSIIDSISNNQNTIQASRKIKERKDELKIASKSVKDSHYQIDVAKETVSKNGKQVHMVSCYARDAYLGRYLIKRNFFYTIDREAAADEAYDEIVGNMSAIKERYYSGVIDVPAVTNQMVKVLDGVVAEVKFEDDNISNVSRNN